MKTMLSSHHIQSGLIIFTVLLFSLLTSITIGRSFIGIGDANIYFIYMRNIANDNGFVYGENVEGFTSLLWTLKGNILYKFTDHILSQLFLI